MNIGISLSGGVDSMVLLDILIQIKNYLTMQIVQNNLNGIKMI